MRGKKDELVGLKENGIIGRLIPVGTGTGWLQGDAEDIGAPVCLIGMAATNEFRLMMTPVGKVYASDLSVRFLGNSGPEAIDKIYSGTPWPGIY